MIFSKLHKITFLFFGFSLLMVSCEDKHVEIEPAELNSSKVDEENPNSIVNNFIWEYMNNYYLWESQLPQESPVLSQDPNEFFDKIIYDEEDRWSFVVKDYQKLLDNLSGIVTASGYEFRLISISDNGTYIGVVRHVYPNSPASDIGLEPGDVFLKINGQSITKSTFESLLFDSETLEMSLAKIVNGQIVASDEKKTLTKRSIDTPPVGTYNIREYQGKKVAYLHYIGFINEYDDDLVNVLAEFESAGVDELILDLRYNGGGSVSTAIKLASILAPSSALGKPFIKKIWNDKLTKAFLSEEGIDSEAFVQNLQEESVKLDLSRLYVITTGNTASASELIINGLRPYMEVKTVGSKTHGKYTASTVFYDKDKNHDWALMPIIFKSANANGITDYGDGFQPFIFKYDDLFHVLGSEEEACYAAAWNDIFNLPNLPARENSSFKVLENIKTNDGNSVIDLEMIDDSILQLK